jgi:hypothetical protein
MPALRHALHTREQAVRDPDPGLREPKIGRVGERVCPDCDCFEEAEES